MKAQIAKCIVAIVQHMRKSFYDAISTGNTSGHVRKLQPTLVIGNGVIRFEKDVQLGYFPSPFFLNGYVHIEARSKNSSINFGEDTYINNNFVAIAEHTSITIGKRCLVGTHVEMYDSDFHGMAVADRRVSDAARAKPVVIGHDVFIGSNVKILKGVVIGDGSVIANGSIVVDAIPPGVIAGGNPARVLKVI